MQLFRIVLVALVMLAAACTGPEPLPPRATTTTAPDARPTITATAPPSSTSTLPAVDPARFDPTGCEDPAPEFDVLCEAYRVITARYVDSVSGAQLAAGAAEAVAAAGTASNPTGTTYACALPTPDFVPFCEAYAARVDRTERDDLIVAAIEGMVNSLDDPFSVYLSPEALERVNESTSGRVEGIGALVRAEYVAGPEQGEACAVLSDWCRMIVVTPLDGSPAASAGILADDVVVAVDGADLTGWTMDEAVAQVRGPAGTEVGLGLLRGDERVDVVVVRAAVVVPVVDAELLAPGVGYLQLTLFTENSSAQVGAALADLLDQGADTIIFDLQNNPGGRLQAAIRVASHFLASGGVVQTVEPGSTTEYGVQPGGVATDPSLDIVVLVNRGSASASELVAGALQEAGRATILGQPTNGKNTVQQQFRLDNGGAVKLTIARWLTPGGLDFGGDGIQPDELVTTPAGSGPRYLVDVALERVTG